MIRQAAIAVLVTVLTGVGAFGQTGEVRKIDLYVAGIDAMTKAAGRPHLIFADTADFADAEIEPAWRRFESEEALTVYREQEKETFQVAFVWMVDGKPAVSNFTRFSPSGDWAQYDLHYFRTDGTVAKIVSELRTFYGNFALRREIWFNSKGVQIASSRSYSDLETGKPMKRPKDAPENRINRYGDVARLPFHKLMPI
jgi:hypothetical protein